MTDKKLKIQKVKGRAMLYWVGKKPIDTVESYPAQLVETVGDVQALATPTYDALEKNWSNLLFHGDNKEILSTLLTNGFRGKVDLIYIDPPFDSKADYVRKVELRGTKNKLDGEEQTAIEQVQYEDIWANDNYLQFMYERLILMRELLSEKGSIYLHCDPYKNYQLRLLLDEVFGNDRFHNEIAWCYAGGGAPEMGYPSKHDTIFLYSKGTTLTFNTQYRDYSEKTKQRGRTIVKGENAKLNDNGTPVNDWWVDIEKITSPTSYEKMNYPTQKSEALLSRIIQVSSDKNALVLDAFIGSGTTAAVAQKLGRRWIGADINKGAIQTTMKRLQKIGEPNILHYRVNNYDFQQMSALRAIIVEKYGVEESKTDAYFDGTVGNRLVKIAELNKPVTKLDVQGIINELQNRPDEDRDVLLVGSGKELGVDTMLAERQQLQGSPNKIEVKDIQTDGIIVAEPAEADVAIEKNGNKVKIQIKSYISPTIIKRLDLDRSIFGEHIKDFRAQIDTVMIDTNYNGKTFNVFYSDVPARKQDLVLGEYELDYSRGGVVAVKITDMLGEETLIIQ